MIRVLIVEDDPMVAKINADYIGQVSPFQVVGHAQNGQEALEYLEVNPVDLLVLDIYMPKMDGLELLQTIRGRFNQVDVIFVTAAKERSAINRGLQLGAVDYLIKPFTFDRIRTALERYHKRYQTFHGKEVLNQQELDELLASVGDVTGELPKGIHGGTLESVEGWIGGQEGSHLDLAALSRALSITTVTARRYLEYLVETGALSKEMKYGSVGRPTYLYRKK